MVVPRPGGAAYKKRAKRIPHALAQQQTIETTILGLQTLMASWARKHRPADNLFLLATRARKARGS